MLAIGGECIQPIGENTAESTKTNTKASSARATAYDGQGEDDGAAAEREGQDPEARVRSAAGDEHLCLHHPGGGTGTPEREITGSKSYGVAMARPVVGLKKSL